MARKVYVDQNECTGCGLCASTCPEVFRINDQGLAEVHNPEGASEEEINNVMEGCPVLCIHWED